MEVQYTETAREILRQARFEAMNTGYFAVNTGHIFNRLKVVDSIGKRILEEICGPQRWEKMSVEYDKDIQNHFLRGVYSPRAKIALSGASALAGDSRVNSGHLLLGLAYEPEGEAHIMFQENEIYPDMIARKFDELLRNGASEL